MLSHWLGVVQLKVFQFLNSVFIFEGMQHGVIHDGEPKGLPLDVVTLCHRFRSFRSTSLFFSAKYFLSIFLSLDFCHTLLGTFHLLLS